MKRPDDSYQIRPASPVDARGVARVHVDTWRDAYRGMVSDEYLGRLEYSRSEERWAESIADTGRPTFRYVAEEKNTGEIIGFSVGGPQRSDIGGYTGELYALYVLPDKQGKGVGYALTRAVAQGLAASGMFSMIVWVLTENEAGRRFYERIGGKWAAEQDFELAGQTLKETGYGWEDLGELAGIAIE